jgi:phosphatidylglycerophosphatase A
MGNTFDRRMSYAAVNAEANALAALANSGYIRIYDGTRPTNADTAVGAQILLAELRFGATAFGASANGVITANPITADASANAGGTASWARILQSDGTTVLWDDEVGTATANIILNSVTIGAGASVSITALTHTVPRS